MPGKSREVYQEGIIIPAVKLYRRGEIQDDVMRLILANVRTPAERRGDLNAQLAALRIGQLRVAELARRNGADLVTAGFAALLDYAERRMRRCLAEFPPGTYYAEDFLDDDGWSDEPVKVALAITVSPEKLVLDYTGSSPQRPGNINAVAPMTYSASFFAIKVLTDPGGPGQCRHLSQRRASPAGRLVPCIAPAGGGVRRQYRDDAARRRHRAQSLRPIRSRPGAGGEPGHDEFGHYRRP